jgi:hypothetical protein
VKLQHGDRVHLKSEDPDGIVVETKTRTVVVRVSEDSGKVREHHVHPDDVERLPTTKEAVLEVSRARPIPVMTLKVDPARWICVDDAHVREDRVDAWLSAVRTLYDAMKDDGIEQSVALVSFHRRRVLTISTVTGHEVLHKMRYAWDDHKLFAEHRDIPEDRRIDLMRVVRTTGNARLDDEPTFAYACVSVKSPPAEMPAFTASAEAFLENRSGAKDLQGGALLAADDDGRELLFTRWAGHEAARAFVDNARHHLVLRPTERLGDEAEAFETSAY